MTYIAPFLVPCSLFTLLKTKASASANISISIVEASMLTYITSRLVPHHRSVICQTRVTLYSNLYCRVGEKTSKLNFLLLRNWSLTFWIRNQYKIIFSALRWTALLNFLCWSATKMEHLLKSAASSVLATCSYLPSYLSCALALLSQPDAFANICSPPTCPVLFPS